MSKQAWIFPFSYFEILATLFQLFDSPNQCTSTAELFADVVGALPRAEEDGYGLPGL